MRHINARMIRTFLEPADLPTALDRLAGWFSDAYASGLESPIRFVHQCARCFGGSRCKKRACRRQAAEVRALLDAIGFSALRNRI